MYLALKKCKNDCKIFKITLVQIPIRFALLFVLADFCPLKTEIAPSSIGFRLKRFIQLKWEPHFVERPIEERALEVRKSLLYICAW